MKLAEALALRAADKKRLNELAARMTQNAKGQEGTTAAEDANALVEEFDGVVAEYEAIIEQINRTNLSAKIADGRTMTRAIAARDCLAIRLNVYRKLAEEGVIKQTVQTRSEVRFVSYVNVTQLRKQIDAMAKEYRELEVMIQAANWAEELLD